MKKLIFILFLFGCTKEKTACYDCLTITSGPNSYQEDKTTKCGLTEDDIQIIETSGTNNYGNVTQTTDCRKI